MGDLARFLGDCLSNGTMLFSACALLIVPVLAWGVIRLLVPTLRRMEADSAWQASLAAAAAVIPGALVLALGSAALVSGLHSPCLQTQAGRVLFSVVGTAMMFSLVRAAVLATRRRREARALIRVSRQPSARLRRAGERAGVIVRELPDSQPFCALAGIRRSVVVVSLGTVSQLSDAELDAALVHERGHARRGDQVVAAVLAFVVDLLPLPSADLVALYRDAREFAADEHALRTVSPHDLAGALLTVARGQRAAANLAQLQGATGLRRRLHLLLHGPSSTPVSVRTRFIVAFTLAAVLVAGLAPAPASMIVAMPCEHQQSAAAARS
jgi:beta-lactamase regulating signal transducer with metallopeptidase domain